MASRRGSSNKTLSAATPTGNPAGDAGGGLGPQNGAIGGQSTVIEIALADDDAQLARETLRAVARDVNAPAAARAQAARTLAEICGIVGKNAEKPAETVKDLAQMSVREIDAEIRRLGSVSETPSERRRSAS